MTEKDWRSFASLKDEDIDTSDIPELDESFWENTKLVIPQNKTPVSLRVDQEVLAWFKSQGKGYQSLMNAVLRSYAEANDSKKKKPSAKKVVIKSTSKSVYKGTKKSK